MVVNGSLKAYVLFLVRRFSIPPLLSVWALIQSKHTVIEKNISLQKSDKADSSKFGKLKKSMYEKEKKKVSPSDLNTSTRRRNLTCNQLMGLTHRRFCVAELM